MSVLRFLLAMALALTLGGAAQAMTILPGLIGGDLTDPENNINDNVPASPNGGSGYNWLTSVASGSNWFSPGKSPAEAALDLFDNKVGGGEAKWYDGGVLPNYRVAIELPLPYVLTHFTVASANDVPNRDPDIWQIQGSNDGSTWNTIFSRNMDGTSAWTARNQVIRWDGGGVDFATPPAYSWFRFEATSIVSGSDPQLSEIELFGTLPPATTLTWNDTNNNWDTANWLGSPPTFPTAAEDAIVNGGTVTVARASEAARILQVGGGTVAVGAGNTLQLAQLTGGGGTILLNAGSSLVSTAGGVLGNVDIVSGTASLSGIFTAATLDFAANSGLNVTGGSLTASAVSLAGGTGTLDTAAGTSASLSSIGETAPSNIAYTGLGTVALPTANTYSGTTTIGPGVTVQMGNNASLGTEAGKTTIQSGGTLDVRGFRVGANGNELVEVQGTGVGGNGAIINTGGSQTSAFRQITLTGPATFRADSRWDMRNTGGASTFDMGGFTLTKVGGSELALVNTDILNEGSVNVNQGIFRIEGSTRHDGPGTITVAGGATLDFWNNSQTHGPSLTLQSGSNLTANGGGGPTLAGTVNLSGTANIVTNNNISITGQVTGAGSLVKQGGATLFLTNGGNNYGGRTYLSGGTIEMAADGVLGTGPARFQGGALGNSGLGVRTLANAIELSGYGTIGVTTAGKTGDIVLNGAPSLLLDSILTVNNQATLNGNLTGAHGFEKRGPGTLTLAGNNSYTGTTTVGEGTLVAASNTALGTTAGGTVVGGGGTLVVPAGITIPAGEALTLGSLWGSGTLSSVAGTTYGGNIALGSGTMGLGGSSATLDSQAGTLTVGGGIDMANSSLTVTGAGDTVIQGAITGANLSSTVYVPGLLAGSRSGNPWTGTPNPGNLGITLGPSGMLRDGGARDAEREAHWLAPRADGGTGPDSTTLVYTGQIYVSGTTTYVEQNDDVTRLTIGGTLIINDGSWNNAVRATYTPPSGPGWYSFDVRFSNGTGGYGFFGQQNTGAGDSNWDVVSGGIAGGFGSAPGTIPNENALSYTYTEDPGDASLFRVQLDASPNNLTKSGAGTLTLNGNNTYVGTTTVQQGTLSVNGITSGQGDYIIQSGATLGGTGTVGLAGGNSVTIQGGGTIAPGLSPGTLAIVGDLVMANGSVYEWECGTTVEDLIALSGNLDLNDWTLRILDAGGDTYAWQKHYIFTGFSSLSGPNNVTFDLSQVPHWAQFTTSLDLGIDEGGMYLTGLNSIPEPGALALLALGGLALLRRRRRRSAR